MPVGAWRTGLQLQRCSRAVRQPTLSGCAPRPPIPPGEVWNISVICTWCAHHYCLNEDIKPSFRELESNFAVSKSGTTWLWYIVCAAHRVEVTLVKAGHRAAGKQRSVAATPVYSGGQSALAVAALLTPSRLKPPKGLPARQAAVAVPAAAAPGPLSAERKAETNATVKAWKVRKHVAVLQHAYLHILHPP